MSRPEFRAKLTTASHFLGNIYEPPTPAPTPVPTNFNRTLPASKSETPAATRAANWMMVICLAYLLAASIAAAAFRRGLAQGLEHNSKKNSLLDLWRQSREPGYGSIPLTPVARPVEEAPSEAGSATAAALEFERRAEERVPRGTSTPSAPPLSQLV